MTLDEAECLKELVRIVGGTLDTEDVSWTPVAGNLLAVYRHGRLVIPWDDDYDIALLRADEWRGVSALHEKMPHMHGMLIKIGDCGRKDWGTVYKACFDVDHPKFSHVIRTHGEYTWPFVDVFIGGTEQGSMGVMSLEDYELPLRDVIIDGITLHVPSRGKRCLQEFQQRPDLMQEAVEQEHSHRYEMSCPCVGKTSKPVIAVDARTLLWGRSEP